MLTEQEEERVMTGESYGIFFIYWTQLLRLIRDCAQVYYSNLFLACSAHMVMKYRILKISLLFLSLIYLL